jgi:hypothetical protein
MPDNFQRSRGYRESNACFGKLRAFDYINYFTRYLREAPKIALSLDTIILYKLTSQRWRYRTHDSPKRLRII